MVLLNAFQKHYEIIPTEEVVCKAARKRLNFYYKLMVLENLAGEATQTE